MGPHTGSLGEVRAAPLSAQHGKGQPVMAVNYAICSGFPLFPTYVLKYGELGNRAKSGLLPRCFYVFVRIARLYRIPNW